jgi:hypothetical protein
MRLGRRRRRGGGLKLNSKKTQHQKAMPRPYIGCRLASIYQSESIQFNQSTPFWLSIQFNLTPSPFPINPIQFGFPKLIELIVAISASNRAQG